MFYGGIASLLRVFKSLIADYGFMRIVFRYSKASISSLVAFFKDAPFSRILYPNNFFTPLVIAFQVLIIVFKAKVSFDEANGKPYTV